MNGHCDNKAAFALIVWTVIFLVAVACNSLFMWLAFIGFSVIELGIIFLCESEDK